jgi:Fe-S cluster assembly ATP-binding protein
MDSIEFLNKAKAILSELGLDDSFLKRSINDGFSGGEKKKSEILQLLTIDPKLAVLDETDSGLDVDALRTVAKGVNKFKNENNSVLIITHYQRLLDYIKPDVVHLMIDGQIVKTGDMSLVEKVEKDGYSWLEK